MLGMWISVDPVREFYNSYAYGPANPANGYDRGGLYWEFAINSGRLTYIDNSTGKRTLVAFGYAGRDEALNVSDYQHIASVGPLPTGEYKINMKFEDFVSATGSNVRNGLRLIPSLDNEMLGRSRFWIHGAGTNDPFGASNGCMIFPLNIRQQILESNDDLLYVFSYSDEDDFSSTGNLTIGEVGSPTVTIGEILVENE